MLASETTRPSRSSPILPGTAAERIRPASRLSRYWAQVHGLDDGMNMFAYVGADPVNFTDPAGLASCPAGETLITPTGSRIPRCVSESPGPGQASSSNTNRGALLSGGGGAALAEADGGYVCVKNCAPAGFTPGSGDNLGTFTARAGKYQWVSSGLGFYVSDGKYRLNPHFTRSPYSDAFDLSIGILFAGPIAIMGATELAGGTPLVGTRFLFSNAQIGKVIGWGAGRNAAGQAAARAGEISRSEVARMRSQGLTREMAVHFRDQYARAIRAGRGGETARARLTLMERILRHW